MVYPVPQKAPKHPKATDVSPWYGVYETPLCKLALKYKSDKCRRRGKHTYTEYYYKLLKDKRKTVKKVLEIGIGKGASLRMWRDFFPNAKIYGIDYVSRYLVNEDRIESILADQRRKEHLTALIDKIGSDIDLVIDDGSHRPRDQVFTCLNLMPLLKKSVTYIIEDVADPAIIERLKAYDAQIPGIPNNGRYDNRLVVVHKKEQIDISIFAKPAFLDVDPSRPFRYTGKPPKDGHLRRISSIVRGEQIANFIGAKLNPATGYQNDVCIYIKPPYRPGQDFLFEGRKSYLDICDSPGFFELLKKHPEVTVISASDLSFNTLKRILPNKIVNIHEHHCNFERLKRNREKITTVGCIGTAGSFDYLPKELKEQLAKRGMEFVESKRFFTREEVVNFYLNIDIQIVWRPYLELKKNPLNNPLKIVNASSFGIPTIAYEEKSAKEVSDCYIPVHTLDELLVELDKLRSNPKLYDQHAKRCIAKSEAYHIAKIAKLYKNLAYE